MELTVVEQKLVHIPDKREFGALLCKFIDVAATASQRASFYNSREEMEQAVNEVHDAVFVVDRGIYTVLLAFPGVRDYSRQIGVVNLLDNPRNDEPAFLDEIQEKRGIDYLSEQMSIQRRLKMFEMLASRRVNNARTRKLILRTILNDPNLKWHALKYRQKLRTALVHAWGVRTASILIAILKKMAMLGELEMDVRLSEKEFDILKQNVRPYHSGLLGGALEDSLRFILGGNWVEWEGFKAYYDSVDDFDALAQLPPEVAEGKRSTYHPDRTPAEVLELTKDKLTSGQQMIIQRSAAEKGVVIDFDPKRYDAVKLYIYAHEMGMTEEIRKALKEKAFRAAQSLPMKFGQVGIVVDTSKSMMGSETQKYRPMAIVLALRDVIHSASEGGVTYYGGKRDFTPEPHGETALARLLFNVIQHGVEHVFVLTDGYENAPAGRFNEVVAGLRKIGIDTPITQITPVMASEVYGVRMLSPQVPVLPLSGPEGFGLAMVKNLLEEDLVKGIHALMNVVQPKMIGGEG